MKNKVLLVSFWFLMVVLVGVGSYVYAKLVTHECSEHPVGCIRWTGWEYVCTNLETGEYVDAPTHLTHK